MDHPQTTPVHHMFMYPFIAQLLIQPQYEVTEGQGAVDGPLFLEYPARCKYGKVYGEL